MSVTLSTHQNIINIIYIPECHNALVILLVLFNGNYFNARNGMIIF